MYVAILMYVNHGGLRNDLILDVHVYMHGMLVRKTILVESWSRIYSDRGEESDTYADGASHPLLGKSDMVFEGTGRLANILLCSGLGTELLIVDIGDNTMIHITCTNIMYADCAHVRMHSNI